MIDELQAIRDANALIERQQAEIRFLKARLEETSSSELFRAMEEEVNRLTALTVELSDELRRARETSAWSTDSKSDFRTWKIVFVLMACWALATCVWWLTK